MLSDQGLINESDLYQLKRILTIKIKTIRGASASKSNSPRKAMPTLDDRQATLIKTSQLKVRPKPQHSALSRNPATTRIYRQKSPVQASISTARTPVRFKCSWAKTLTKIKISISESQVRGKVSNLSSYSRMMASCPSSSIYKALAC